MAETEAAAEKEYIRDAILDTEEMKKMFVGGISTDTKDDEVKSYFEDISNGKVTNCVIIRKDKDKKSHFGFITFESSELIDEVLLKRADLKINDRKLDVNRAVPKNNTSTGAHEKTKKLFIANLPKLNCSEEDLTKYFEDRHPPKYGKVESVQLIKKKDEKGNKTEENKGFGFVLVSSEDMADKMAIQHATFEFGSRKVELKKSVPTSEGGGFGERKGRGGGPVRGGRGGGRGGRGGGQYQGGNNYDSYGGGYGGGAAWDPYGYNSGGYGYDYGYASPYGGGYAPPTTRGRGAPRGGPRYKPY